MKQSHFTTPRTIADGTWQAWGEAIEPMPRSRGGLAMFFYAVALVLTCAASAIVIL